MDDGRARVTNGIGYYIVSLNRGRVGPLIITPTASLDGAMMRKTEEANRIVQFNGLIARHFVSQKSRQVKCLLVVCKNGTNS